MDFDEACFLKNLVLSTVIVRTLGYTAVLFHHDAVLLYVIKQFMTKDHSFQLKPAKSFQICVFFMLPFIASKTILHEIIQMLEVQTDLLCQTTIKFWRVPSFLTDLLPLKPVLLSETPSINAETSQYIWCIF